MLRLSLLDPRRAPDEARTLANGFELAFAAEAHTRAIEKAGQTGGQGARQVVLDAATLIEGRNRRRRGRCASALGRFVARLAHESMECGVCPAAGDCQCAAASRLARTARHQ